MSTTETLRFQPFARLLTMLGDQLIKNERIALVEVVKNSYDADASWAKLEFDNFGTAYEVSTASKIVIEDDGDGMTGQILRDHWVSPATPVKKIGKLSNADTTPKGRKIQGEKGIGRFAILKLGKTIDIYTRPKGSNTEFHLTLDLSHYDDDFLTEDGKPKQLLLSDIGITLREGAPSRIRGKTIALGKRSLLRAKHGTRIEVSNIRGAWTQDKVDDVYEDLVRLQSIFLDAMKEPKKRQKKDVAFEVLIYKDSKFQDHSTRYLSELTNLLKQNSVLRIEGGTYSEEDKAFEFSLNGKVQTLDLSDPDVKGLKVFRDRFGKEGEKLPKGGTSCGSFSFGFYVFDFSKEARGKHSLDLNEKQLLKKHRIYLYRDGIRVYPYGDPKDDWLEIDAYRGTISAGQFLSNDQVVGFVNITQEENPNLKDKTNREGLIDTGSPTEDFLALLKILLAWIRKKPYAIYRRKLQGNHGLDVFKHDRVNNEFTALEEQLEGNSSAQAAVSRVRRFYQTERNYLVQRAETTEHLAGVGLSVETASHDIMAVMLKALGMIDTLIQQASLRGPLDKEIIGRDLATLRGMLSFIESQLKNIQLLFKSTKQRRREIRVKDVLEKVQRLFQPTLSKTSIDCDVVETGPPLVAKTTDAVLLQLFLNLFDNAVYWLETKTGKRRIQVTLDGNTQALIFSDDGPGIKEDDAPYIFDAFYSGRGEDGRGLGLYIAKQLLERHDYDIDLADLKSQRILRGANFVVTFVKDSEDA